MRAGTMALNADGELQQKDRAGQGPEERRRHQTSQGAALANELQAVAVNARESSGDEAHGVGDVGNQWRQPEEQQRGERDQRSGSHHGVDGPCSHTRGQQGNDFIPRHPVTLGENDRALCVRC